MAQKIPIAVGIDIGTHAVRCVIGLMEAGAPVPSIVGVGEAKNSGVRKGVVVDIEEAVSAISGAVDEAERIAGVKVGRAALGVNGSHILSISSHGIIAVGSGNREINPDDVKRVQEAAMVMQLPPNREIIQAFPHNYAIDGQDHIKDPVGMSGLRLEVDTHLITAATPFVKNSLRSLSQAGIEANQRVVNPLAAAEVVVDKQHRELGVVMLDIGSATTGLAVFEEGELLHIGVIPVGSGHISNDLAIGLRTDIDTAEKIKLEHVDAAPVGKTKTSDQKLRIKETNGDEMIVSKKEISSIAQARLDELFGLVNQELRKVNRDGMLPGGAILCGGGANMAHIDDFAKHILRLPAQIGQPHGFAGIVEKIQAPSFAACVGLMLADIVLPQEGGKPSRLHLGSTAKGVGGKIIDWLRKP